MITQSLVQMSNSHEILTCVTITSLLRSIDMEEITQKMSMVEAELILSLDELDQPDLIYRPKRLKYLQEKIDVLRQNLSLLQNNIDQSPILLFNVS